MPDENLKNSESKSDSPVVKFIIELRRRHKFLCGLLNEALPVGGHVLDDAVLVTPGHALGDHHPEAGPGLVLGFQANGAACAGEIPVGVGVDIGDDCLQ